MSDAKQRRFRRYKRIEWLENRIEYRWFYIDTETREGVDFHGVKLLLRADAIQHNCNHYGFRADGLEEHQRRGREGEKPLLGCEITGGHCYPDGTTLHARRMLGHIDPDHDDDFVWQMLLEWYERRFPPASTESHESRASGEEKEL